MNTELPWDIIGKLLFAAFLGGMIGFERGQAGRAAGLRTNILIAMSTCIFTLLAIKSFGPTNGDSNTIIGHIITGVGFLGAGAVLHHKEKTFGLTTAASVWLVAGLGIAAGAGEYFLGFFAATVGLIVLFMLEPVSLQLDEYSQQRGRLLVTKTVRLPLKQRSKTKRVKSRK